MSGYFPPKGRSDSASINDELKILERSPVVEALLDSVSGLLAIVDENRQIISVNDQLLKDFGFEQYRDLLGLRPGEAFKCIHSHDDALGCGHSEHCPSCGLALSIVLSELSEQPVERICALDSVMGNENISMAIKVRSHPIMIESRRFYLIFLQDISKKTFWISMEKIFIHDLNNVLTALMGTLDLMEAQLPEIDPHQLKNAGTIARRIKQEVDLQRTFLSDIDHHWSVENSTISLTGLADDLRKVFMKNPAAHDIVLDIRDPEDICIQSDYSLVMRVLSNMLINALEASSRGSFVKLWVECEEDQVLFHVWNESYIPVDIQKRIFQKHFSSKNEEGHGLGTYSMKLLGEKILKGKVSFVSDPEAGTTFSFILPILKVS